MKDGKQERASLQELHDAREALEALPPAEAPITAPPVRPKSVFLSIDGAFRLGEILGRGSKRATIKLRRAWRSAVYDPIEGRWKVGDLGIEIALNNRRVVSVRRSRS